MDIRIVSLNVGKPQTVELHGQQITTGINKRPSADTAIALSRLNFEGDGQADLVYHGGEAKAVCVYSYEHYEYWEKKLGVSLSYGAFGENLTAVGLTEDVVCIGDVYAIGDIRLQVTQPRQPCYKLARKYGIPELPLLVQNTGFTGFYFRVLQPGLFDRNKPFELERRHPAGLTVAYANRIKHHDKNNMEAVRQFLTIPELSESWRISFEKRLHGKEPSSDPRLKGT